MGGGKNMCKVSRLIVKLENNALLPPPVQYSRKNETPQKSIHKSNQPPLRRNATTPHRWLVIWKPCEEVRPKRPHNHTISLP